MGIHFSQSLGIVRISASLKVFKKHLTLECSIFSYFFRTIRNHFPHVLWTIPLTWRLTKKFYLRSHFHSNVYVKLFNKELNLFCCWTQSKICISDPFAFVMLMSAQIHLQRFAYSHVLDQKVTVAFDWESSTRQRSKYVSDNFCRIIFYLFVFLPYLLPFLPYYYFLPGE